MSDNILTKTKNLSYFVHDILQGFTPQAQGIHIAKPIWKYPRDTIRILNSKDTQKVQDQDV
jgi:hypothetical protein